MRLLPCGYATKYAQLPNVGSEIERVVTDDPDRITPYVGVRADDFTALETAFDHDPTSDELPLAM